MLRSVETVSEECKAGPPSLTGGSYPRCRQSCLKGRQNLYQTHLGKADVHFPEHVIILAGPSVFQWASQVALAVKNLPTMQETQETWFDPWLGKIPWRRK